MNVLSTSQQYFLPVFILEFLCEYIYIFKEATRHIEHCPDYFPERFPFFLSTSSYSISIFWMKKKAYPRKKCVLTDWVTLLAVLLKQREIFTSFTGKGQIQLAIPPPCIKRQKYFPLLSPPKSREHHGTKHLLDIFGEMLSQV